MYLVATQMLLQGHVFPALVTALHAEETMAVICALTDTSSMTTLACQHVPLRLMHSLMEHAQLALPTVLNAKTL